VNPITDQVIIAARKNAFEISQVAPVLYLMSMGTDAGSHVGSITKILVDVAPVSPEGALLSLAGPRSGKNGFESTVKTVCQYLSHPRPFLFCAGLRMLHQWVGKQWGQ
jgi:hypothetical protein